MTDQNQIKAGLCRTSTTAARCTLSPGTALESCVGRRHGRQIGFNLAKPTPTQNIQGSCRIAARGTSQGQSIPLVHTALHRSTVLCKYWAASVACAGPEVKQAHSLVLGWKYELHVRIRLGLVYSLRVLGCCTSARKQANSRSADVRWIVGFVYYLFR